MTSDRIVAVARRWIGTPFHHQAALRKVGCDCLGLVRGVWLELGGTAPHENMDYDRYWCHRSGPNLLIQGLSAYLRPVPIDDIEHGDVIACAMRFGAAAQHVGFLTQDQSRRGFVHSHSEHGVQETAFDPIWSRLAVAAFRFPNKG